MHLHINTQVNSIRSFRATLETQLNELCTRSGIKLEFKKKITHNLKAIMIRQSRKTMEVLNNPSLCAARQNCPGRDPGFRKSVQIFIHSNY